VYYYWIHFMEYTKCLYHFLKVSSCHFLIHTTIFWQIVIEIASCSLFYHYYVRLIKFVATRPIQRLAMVHHLNHAWMTNTSKLTHLKLIVLLAIERKNLHYERRSFVDKSVDTVYSVTYS